jgi:pentatricopeptide repeat protein
MGVFRVGSVNSSGLLIQLVDQLKEQGKLDVTSARQTLQNCGKALVDTKPDRRVGLALSFWKSFTDNGIDLDVTHFNALLTAYVENDHKFAPLELVEEMRQKEINPNAATFQLLLKSYCQQGDVNGANLVLDHMKNEGMPMSEPILAPLIMAYARAEGLDRARDAFEEIKQEGFQPGLESYRTLLCSLAENGHVEEIDKVLTEMNGARLFPPITFYTDVIESLSSHGHTHLIDSFLESIKNIARMRSDLESVMKLLLVRGDIDGAMVILQRIARVTVSSQSDMLRPGRQFLSHLLICDPPYSVDFLLKTVFDLRSHDLHRSPYEELLLNVFNREDTDNAITVIKAMLSASVPVKPHYFYPLFAQYKKHTNLEGCYNVLKLMKDHGYVYGKPHLDYLVETAANCGVAEGIAQGLVDHGIRFAPQEMGLLMQSLVAANCIDSAVQVVKSDVISFENRGVRGMFKQTPIPDFSKGVIRTDLPIFKLFKALRDHADIPPESLSAIGKEFVTTICRRFDPRTAIQSLETLLHMGVRVTHYLPYTEIMTALSRVGDAEKMQKLLKLMKEYDIPVDAVQRRIALRLAARTGKGDMAIEAFIGGQPANFKEPSQPMSELIMAYGRDDKRSLESMMNVYDELVSKGLRPTASAYGYLVGRNLRDRNVTMAEKIKQEMQEVYPFSPSLYRAFMTAYARRGDVEDLKKILAEAESLGHEFDPSKWFHLIEAHAVHGDSETAEKLFDEMKQETRVAKLRARPAWSQLTIAYANRGDVEGALKVIARAKEEGIKPTLRTYFMIMNRAAVLRREDILTKMNELILEDFEVMKQQYVDGLLFYAHARAGNLEKAEEFLPKVNYRENESLYGTYVNKCALEGDVERIERLMDQISDEPARNRYDLCGMPLLRAYKIHHNPDACLALYEDFVQQGVKVSPRFKVLLATILEEHGREVPAQLLRATNTLKRQPGFQPSNQSSADFSSSSDDSSDSDSSSSSDDEGEDVAEVDKLIDHETENWQSRLDKLDTIEEDRQPKY